MVKKIYKRIVCAVLALTLCISAPFGGYKRIDAQAAVPIVALGGAALALVFMGSVGINYIISSQDYNKSNLALEDYVDTQIIEFSKIGGNMPKDPKNNYKLTALGALVLGSQLSNWLTKFSKWIKDKFAEDYYNVYAEDWINTDLGYSVPCLDYHDGRFDGSFHGMELDELVKNDKKVYSNDPFIQLFASYRYINENGSEGTFAWKIGQSIPKYSKIYSPYSDSVTSNVSRCYASSLVYFKNLKRFGYISDYYTHIDGSVSYSYGMNLITNQTDQSFDQKRLEIAQKVSTFRPPAELPDTDGLEITTPSSVPLTQPTPSGDIQVRSETDIMDDILSSINTNTDTAINFNPSYTIVNNYDKVTDINGSTVPKPEPEPDPDPKPEPEPDPNPQPDPVTDLDAATDLIGDMFDWFKGIFDWDSLKKKFPFSIPYDLYLVSTAFSDKSYDVYEGLPSGASPDEAVAPVYKLSLPNGAGGTYDIELDMSLISEWMPVIRAGVGVLFTVILLTGV